MTAIDKLLKTDTPNGPVWHRYNGDGYGEHADGRAFDGSGHGHPDQQAHDAERTRFLASLGIKELRFWNSRLRRDKQAIRDMIFRELQARAPHPLPDYTRPMTPPDVGGDKS